jgi:DNA-directed RNA polymerase specialized sigma24 family protein
VGAGGAARLGRTVVADPAAGVVTGLALDAAIRQLPARQRLVVVLRYQADLPVADIARALRCAPGTVKSTLHTALARLRVEVADEDEADDENHAHDPEEAVG